MNEIVCKMINDALTAFINGDLSVIKNFSERDNDVDALRYSIFRECVQLYDGEPWNITICTHYILVARYLERCGDHACNMAEEIYYMVTGEHVEIDCSEKKMFSDVLITDKTRTMINRKSISHLLFYHLQYFLYELWFFI